MTLVAMGPFLGLIWAAWWEALVLFYAVAAFRGEMARRAIEWGGFGEVYSMWRDQLTSIDCEMDCHVALK